MNVEEFFKTNKLADFREIPIDNFAYIGDAVMALKYKLLILKDGRKKPFHLNERSKDFLSAKAHDDFALKIFPQLSEKEKNIYKRGYNSRGAGKRGNDLSYRRSTGLESLIGYLYLAKEFDRLNEIFEVIDKCMFKEEMS
ncbi:Mini-ribonuclease 3 [Geotoga petraea]|jgi:ribonuclease-3 family protein|uniref:Ribonuclease III n=1 Tax=Geotoga petraea TaxID=28234 RepID=A0A1G6N8T5_9BACT|nr:ribonuclease III domain-containing protein [Geotoga petraea]MDK2946380.1 mini-ribonuclease [Geotoga sp.]TGG87212.1 ribonuclease III [Geotoga petraea]SDC63555.1 ribonuclease-3 family protein [Geotoga petraea]